MIPRDLLVKINDLLYEGTPEEPIEINYDNPEWLQVQLEMCLNCHKADQIRLGKLKNEAYSIQNDYRIQSLEDEMKELKELIVTISEELVEKHGKNFTTLLGEDNVIELVQISYEYYEKLRRQQNENTTNNRINRCFVGDLFMFCYVESLQSR